MDEELRIEKVIDKELLSGLLVIFTNLTGMPISCRNLTGEELVRVGDSCDFCNNYVRSSKLGNRLCEQCMLYGMSNAVELDRPVTYLCHCGLMELIAPIKVDDTVIGFITSGQVVVRPIKEEDVRALAYEFELDEQGMVAASKRIYLKSRLDVSKEMESFATLVKMVSEYAKSKYVSIIADAQLRQSSNVKSDFLANMSHEIRTPMNAVIGMAEMALREDMTAAARDYVGQIKSSGRALLNIINDILDYSKIESGKLELSCVEYEPLSLINDVASIIMTRLTDKPVELLIDVDPNIPHTLYGDDLRIRQILINLANNATKFTKTGHVQLKVRYEQIEEDKIMLKASIIDTGIGIKKEDLEKLFSSFQQVDSKRNRNIEGTGLGLSITKNLVELMGGKVTVESEYGVGSTFSIEIPQSVIQNIPSIRLKEPENYALAGFFDREDVAMDYLSDSSKLGVYADDFSGTSDPESAIEAWLKVHAAKKRFILVDEKRLEKTFAEYFATHLDTGANAVLLANTFSDVRQWSSMPYMQIIKKPFSVLNLAGLLESDSCNFGNTGPKDVDADFTFVAPKARILLVDDNEINLSVAEGLLEPLKMQVDTAKSGAEALEKIGTVKYDIVFMDHMMPEMDGVETTRIIRRLHPSYDNVPIIALTANAVSGTKEMFISEGMNDFVAKPIEVRVLVGKVHQWLPPEKIMRLSSSDVKEDSNEEKTLRIPDKMGDLDVKAAFALLGSEKLFWKVLKDYYRVITTKADLIEKLYQTQDWTNYVVEVHALKSASKQIGAMELSNMAAELEKAGNERNISLIIKNTDSTVMKYRSYIPVLAPYCEEEKAEEGAKEAIADDVLKESFAKMLEAIDNLDIVEMTNVIDSLDKYSFDGEKKESFELLKNAVSDIDVDTCENIINNWYE